MYAGLSWILLLVSQHILGADAGIDLLHGAHKRSIFRPKCRIVPLLLNKHSRYSAWVPCGYRRQWLGARPKSFMTQCCCHGFALWLGAGEIRRRRGDLNFRWLQCAGESSAKRG